jgi:hypothetical protein
MDEVNRWDSATKQLGDAIKEWSQISDQIKEEPKVAPDKQLMKDVDALLRHLKSKLDEFNAPPEPLQTNPLPPLIEITKGPKEEEQKI